jgi:DNA invertase Pin-like site-specific DNA recombinase
MNFNRPGAVRMLDMVKSGEVDCIIVKDFSRFSRDYIEAGDYLEQIFPLLGIRFISINDGYDSAIHGSLAGDIGNGFKNLYNSYYCKDISRKTRSGVLAKKESGSYTPGFCPYGFKKLDAKIGIGMVIDEVAAEIIRRIYALRIEGKTMPQIADILNAEQIPTPAMQQKINGSKLNSGVISTKQLWTTDKIRKILGDIRYAGFFAYDMYKAERIGNKATTKIPMKDWTLVPDVIPAIITEEDYNKVQALLKPVVNRTKQTRRKVPADYASVITSIIDNQCTKSDIAKKANRDIQRQIDLAINNKTALYNRYCDGHLSRDEYIRLRDKEDESIAVLREKLLSLSYQEDTLSIA